MPRVPRIDAEACSREREPEQQRKHSHERHDVQSDPRVPLDGSLSAFPRRHVVGCDTQSKAGGGKTEEECESGDERQIHDLTSLLSMPTVSIQKKRMHEQA